jgi:cytoplasmic iron level regulating protein YaaA (DUF328/UPF0246 family)
MNLLQNLLKKYRQEAIAFFETIEAFRAKDLRKNKKRTSSNTRRWSRWSRFTYIKGAKALAEANVVLYDALANEELLSCSQST